MKRRTFAEELQGTGRGHLVQGPFRCRCQREMTAHELFDATPYDDIDGDWRCWVCISDKDREEQAAREAALPWPTEEQLNDVRAKRDLFLLKTDWTELPSNQMRFTDTEREAWASYRQTVRDVVTQAKAGHKVDFPPLPTQE